MVSLTHPEGVLRGVRFETQRSRLISLGFVWWGEGFNEALTYSEKTGGLPRDPRLTGDFQQALEDSRLQDIGASRSKYTWEGQVKGGAWV